MAKTLADASQKFWSLPQVGDIRQEGTILAIELVEDFTTRRPFDPAKRLGAQVCEKARHLGLLTRPVGDVLVLMPPYCATADELGRMVDLLFQATRDTLG
jgi:adenosylmethionine-8-amino-7-oxononanoate aminotransferase